MVHSCQEAGIVWRHWYLCCHACHGREGREEKGGRRGSVRRFGDEDVAEGRRVSGGDVESVGTG